MPIYEYRCECGACLETLESVGTARTQCGELCLGEGAPGVGRIERVISGGLIRGDGREAKEAVIDPCKRSNRPGGGCGGDEW